MNRLRNLVVLFTAFACHQAWGQNVGIGTLTPNASAKLEIIDANRGLLIPRVSLVAVTNGVTPVATPATSLLVYNTNAAVTGGSGTGFYYWDGTQWVKLVPGNALTNDWALLGNAGTNPATNFVGTTDNQPLVFRTNNTEDARMSTNGNVSIGTTTSTTARLHNYLPVADVSTAVGFYNDNTGGATGITYGMRNFNNTTTATTKYGIHNFVSATGIGTHYGIYSETNVDAASTVNSFGGRFIIDGAGSGGTYGFYSDVNQGGTGVAYGILVDVDLPVTNTADAYGNYIDMDYSSGARYGTYNEMNSNATYDGDITATRNDLLGTGDGVAYGVYNNHAGTGTGTKYASYNTFVDAQGTKFGAYNEVAAGANTGIYYGVYNTNLNTSTSTKYGMYNYFDGFTGGARGVSSSIYPDPTSTGIIYGVYNYIDNAGTGTRYGGYFSTQGAAGIGLYSINTDAAGLSGYFIGNVRIASAGRNYGMYADYANSVVRFGSNVGALTGNGTVVAGTTVDYLVDFDKGTAEGSAVGVGSIEYILDGVARTTINNEFDPAAHIVHDLGYSTTVDAWDDVYADDFWNVSDIREKENVRDMTYGLSELMQMRTIAYTRKDDPFQDPKIGLVAQEVLNLVPEAVKAHDHKITDETKPTEFTKVELERLGMSYTNLVPVLVKAIQEQQAEIDALRQEVQSLKQK